jgi:hypothetical protein
MSMAIIGYQIVIFLTIYFSGRAAIYAALFWAAWTIIMVFTLPLGILQFITIAIAYSVRKYTDSKVDSTDTEEPSYDLSTVEDNYANDDDWKYAKLMAQYKKMYQVKNTIKALLPSYDSEASEKKNALNYYHGFQELDEEDKKELYKTIDDLIDARYRRETGQLTFMERLKDLWEMALGLLGFAFFGLLIYFWLFE